ncbi:hypothetical protein DAPPUDRAFT_326206 [Daphnia pulex]|uniref:XRN2-binding (XTBD) domain-containing protein n=1 Tax=Daphnia pulex TaxID=6669 RepID=E9H6V6_DAPPU|nr:hypothetical protein DAPPUDRAFT_326206 [Daphnia pulex]|eukprot:EFX72501.1 hypothetical protein DAPPUDRAFT_326206 [Daphnia pulex]
MEQPPPIEDIRKKYESDLQWNLRRAFIERNEEKMERRKLLKLSDNLILTWNLLESFDTTSKFTMNSIIWQEIYGKNSDGRRNLPG